MSFRDGAGRYLLELIPKSPDGTNFAVMIFGLVLCSGGLLLAGHPKRPNRFKKKTVFDAAPSSLILTGGKSLESTIPNSPPPYSKNAGLGKMHLRHRIPSTKYGVVSVLPIIPVAFTLPSGGTTGIASATCRSPLLGSCAAVEAWLPKRDIVTAPAKNASNNEIVFLISSPVDSTECGSGISERVWPSFHAHFS
jgi:hypothetical protein